MTGMDKHGGRHASRWQVLTLLLSCSPLAIAPQVHAQTLEPTTPTRYDTIHSSPTGLAVDATNELSTTVNISENAESESHGFVNGEPDYTADLNQPQTVGFADTMGGEPLNDASLVSSDPTGIRLGTFILRSTTSQSVNRETIRTGDTKTSRNYLTTSIRGSLVSDWSRHELSVTGEGTFERNFGSDNRFEPEGQVETNLRLDLADDTIANFSGDYSFEREDTNDPNAIGGAAAQSGVHQFGGRLTLERSTGIVHGRAGIGVTREIYTNAELQDGSQLDLADRDRTAVDGRLRLGYEISPALIPFVEVGGGRTRYDETRDSGGYQRSSWMASARTGVEVDLSEKLRGELALGYAKVDYDDWRLETLDAITLDGRVHWSPQRGTDVELALLTTLQDSTAPGESGWAEYNVTTTVTHQLRHNLVGRLTGGSTFRDFATNYRETTWLIGSGLTWMLNPYIDLTADAEYEWTDRDSGDTATWRAGLGVTLRR